jgi:hypothetical protein
MRTLPAFPAAAVRLRGLFAQAMPPNQPRLDLERRVLLHRTLLVCFEESVSGASPVPAQGVIASRTTQDVYRKFSRDTSA